MRIVLACALLAVVPTGYAADADDARAVVAGLFEALVATAAIEPAPGQAARYEALAPAVSAAFDLERMGEIAAGRHWRGWSESERRGYLDAFERLSVTQHATNFARLGPDTAEIVGSGPTADGRQIEVDVVIRRDNGDDDVSLAYRLESGDAGWRIVNVVRMGISSEISALRSEFHAILTEGGLDELLAELEARIASCNAGDCYAR